VRYHSTPARAALAALAFLVLLLPAAARAADQEPDLRAEVEMLAHDLDGLRQQIWSGPRINGYYTFE
jgi:hypothetical protein